MASSALCVAIRVDGAAARPPRLDVALDVTSGVTAIVGPSGAGKSTLLAAIAGLVRPSAGRIVLDGRTLSDASSGSFVAPHARGVGLVFQSLALFPHLSVRDNVAYGIADRARRHDDAATWLARVHAGHLADRAVATLSGGEAQRVALARALAARPKALLLDEPFSALDRPLRTALIDELRALLGAQQIPVLLVTHDRDDAEALASRVIALAAGRVA